MTACRVHGRLHEKRAVTAVCGRISWWVSRWVYMLYVICYMLEYDEPMVRGFECGEAARAEMG